MTEPTEQLIENLKKQIEQKQIERLSKIYMVAIQSVTQDLCPNPAPQYISGSSTLTFNNIEWLSNFYTPPNL